MMSLNNAKQDVLSNHLSQFSPFDPPKTVESTKQGRSAPLASAARSLDEVVVSRSLGTSVWPSISFKLGIIWGMDPVS